MTGSFQPSLVHRMQAAVEGDDIRAAAVVMLRYHQLVPVAQRQARIEDLHDRDAALASQPCRQRAGEVGAEGRGRAGESSRRQPTREARGLQDDLEGPQAKGVGQREHLPAIAGGAVVQRPAFGGRRGGVGFRGHAASLAVHAPATANLR